MPRCPSCPVAALLVEVVAQVGHGAGGVVGSGLHEHGDAMRSKSLVDHLLVVAGIFLACLLDGAFHGVLRHVGRLGVGHEGTQARVGRGVGTTGLDGHGDFLTDLGERAGHAAPTFQFSCFAIFKSSSHNITLIICFVSFYLSQFGAELRLEVFDDLLHDGVDLLVLQGLLLILQCDADGV